MRPPFLRSRLIALAALLGVALLAALGPGDRVNAGGGGCHGYESGAYEASGARVELRGACFVPAILRVAPGAEVTFANLDPVPHNVVGTALAWGEVATFAQGGSVVATFPEAGVYPYACTLHPGMVGAIVVEGGTAVPATASYASPRTISSGAPPAASEAGTSRAVPAAAPAAPPSEAVAEASTGAPIAPFGWLALGLVAGAAGVGAVRLRRMGGR
jgi:plastocyanin